MKKLTLILALLLCLLPGLCAAQSDVPAEKQATLAALDFLELVDQGKYEQCWTRSSALFRGLVEQEEWQQEIGHMRSKLGNYQNRSLQFSKPLVAAAETGYQPGQFLIFRSNFSRKTVAEMLTLSQDPDQQWRVSGYSIQ